MAEFEIDLLREGRIGLDEALFCEGKTTAQVQRIVESMRADRRSMLLTRLEEARFLELSETLRAALDFDPLSRTAFLGPRRPLGPAASVGIVCAGTSDLRVAREAARTLEYYGHRAAEFADVGVAGIHRLLSRIEEIRGYAVVVAVAGMDAALVSVLGGLVKAPVIAVPTSVGYGAARNGETALAASLASCASGVVVVNIDNGYGAACAALRILGRSRA